MPEKDLEPKIEQLLDTPKLKQSDERYEVQIEREIKKEYKTYEFPLSDGEIEKVLEKLPPKDLEGLEKIIITPPLKNEDFKNYGRYIPGKVLLFIHQRVGDNFIIELGDETLELTFEEFRFKAYQAVLHEIGHHVGIKDFKNSSENFAKTYQAEKYLKYFKNLLE